MVKLKYGNVNHKNKKTTDCVTRALTIVLGIDYLEVVKLEYETWIKSGYAAGDRRNFEIILKDAGFVKHKQPKKHTEDGAIRKYRVGEIDELVNKDDLVFITLAGHAVACADLTLIDLWDCRKKSISNYWTKKNDLNIIYKVLDVKPKKVKL